LAICRPGIKFFSAEVRLKRPAKKLSRAADLHGPPTKALTESGFGRAIARERALSSRLNSCSVLQAVCFRLPKNGKKTRAGAMGLQAARQGREAPWCIGEPIKS
jgi:hypothetical protein